MFWDYVNDMVFIYASIIGGIIAISYVYVKRRRAR